MDRPPCVSCVVLEIDEAALRIAPSVDEVSLSRAVRVPAGAAVDPYILDRADAVIVDPPVVNDAPPARLILIVRTFITTLRARRSNIVIAVDAGTYAKAGLPLEPLSAYVDAEIGGRWRYASIPRSPSLSDLVAASTIAGAERVVVPLEHPDWTMLREFAARRSAATSVTGVRTLTAAEIVARHQAQQRKQADALHSAIARGTTAITFEVPGMVAPVTVTAKTTVFSRGTQTDIEERDIRINGASIAAGSGSPRLPLLEPERIATPPLALMLTDAYEYTRADDEEVGGRRAYVLLFTPRTPGAPRGRIWIDEEDFGLLRLQVVQSGLRGPIVSSDQIDDFGRFAAGTSMAHLPIRTRVFQTYDGPGHRTPIYRAVDLPRYEINTENFDMQLTDAYASSHVMLRDTPEGLRYLSNGRVNGGGQVVRAVAFGVTFDPGITTPLPFAGLSYLNLNLFNTGAQVNAFVGGSVGQVSWVIPSLARTRWQVQGSAFAIAARYNDRAFRGGIERYGENIQQRPARASVALVTPLTARVRTRVGYALDVTAFSRAETTAPTFVVPSAAIVHGLVAALEAQRGAWNVRAWVNPAWRQHWQSWGPVDALQPSRSQLARYGASAVRSLGLRPKVSSRLELEWVDGVNLDRFSRYAIDTFQNRLHGYPTASLRYDRGGLARTVTTWSGRGWRVDGFVDTALVRDPGFGDRLRGYPGIGVAIEAGGPWQTLWSVEWGYGINGRRSDGTIGTQAVRINAYRVF